MIQTEETLKKDGEKVANGISAEVALSIEMTAGMVGEIQGLSTESWQCERECPDGECYAKKSTLF